MLYDKYMKLSDFSNITFKIFTFDIINGKMITSDDKEVGLSESR